MGSIRYGLEQILDALRYSRFVEFSVVAKVLATRVIFVVELGREEYLPVYEVVGLILLLLLSRLLKILYLWQLYRIGRRFVIRLAAVELNKKSGEYSQPDDSAVVD